MFDGGSCLNDGECIDLVDGYSCSCPPYASGIRCEIYDEAAYAEFIAATEAPEAPPTTSPILPVIPSTISLDTPLTPTESITPQSICLVLLIFVFFTEMKGGGGCCHRGR